MKAHKAQTPRPFRGRGLTLFSNRLSRRPSPSRSLQIQLPTELLSDEVADRAGRRTIVLFAALGTTGAGALLLLAGRVRRADLLGADVLHGQEQATIDCIDA